MNTSNRNQALAMSFALIFAASAMALPLQAQAAALPGTCDILKNTACCPDSLIDKLLALLSFS